MKSKLIEVFLLYILLPLIIIPFVCYKTGDWYGLFGIIIYYAGLLMAKYRQWIFFPIPLFFCLWYWYTYGVGIRSYVTVFFFCLLAGMLFYRLKVEYDKYVHRVLPEAEQNLEYEAKVNEMNLQIEKFKQDHPGEKITQEIMDKIKADVFF